MKVTEALKRKLEALGMKTGATDEECRAFIAEKNITVLEDEKKPENMSRKLEVLEIAQRMGKFNEISKMFKDGKSPEECTDVLLRSAGEAAPTTANIGMSEKEKKEYSFMRALRLKADGKFETENSFEREISEETAKVLRKIPNGFFVPMDMLSNRAASISTSLPTSATGSNLIATDLLSGSFIDILRNELILNKLGVTFLTGLVGNVAIPKQSGGATGYWLAEDGTVTASDLKFKQVTLTPKTVGAFTEVSRQLLLQSSLSVETLIKQDLAACLAQAIEKGALLGTGANNQPTGVINQTDVNAVAMGTNGAVPSWEKMVEMETIVAKKNVYDNGTMAYLVNAATRGVLKATEKFSGTGKEIWQNGGINEYKAFMTNVLPSDGTKGTGTGLSTALFGRWSDLLIALWGGLDINVNPFSSDTSGAVRITALQSCDVSVRYPEAFAKITDLKA